MEASLDFQILSSCSFMIISHVCRLQWRSIGAAQHWRHRRVHASTPRYSAMPVFAGACWSTCRLLMLPPPREQLPLLTPLLLLRCPWIWPEAIS